MELRVPNSEIAAPARHALFELKLRRDGPILGCVLALFLVFGAGVEWGPNLLRPLDRGETASRSAPSFQDPALTVTDEEAALQLVAGKMSLGDLAKVLKASAFDPTAKAFYKAFMAEPKLREAVRKHMLDKNGRALQRTLVQSREFSKLYFDFKNNEAFASFLLAPSGGAASRAPSTGASGASSMGLVRGGKELAGLAERQNYEGLAASQRASGPDGIDRALARTSTSDFAGQPYVTANGSTAGGSYDPTWQRNARSGEMPGVPPVGTPVPVVLPATTTTATSTGQTTAPQTSGAVTYVDGGNGAGSDGNGGD